MTKQKLQSEKVKKVNTKKSANKDSDLKTLQNDEKSLSNKEKKPKLSNELKNLSKLGKFQINDFIIYPAHGIGQIISLSKIKVQDKEIGCYVINFEREKLTINVPILNCEKVAGLRSVATKEEMDEAFIILRSGIKKLKGMWSRRAQEYESKINSGSITLIAEVIRDLTRDIEDVDRSYSERIIYETAIYRIASEYAKIYNISLDEAKEFIITTAKDKIDTIGGNGFMQNDFDEFDFDEFEKRNNQKKFSFEDDESGQDDEYGDEDDEEEEDEEDESLDNKNYYSDDSFEDSEDFDDNSFSRKK